MSYAVLEKVMYRELADKESDRRTKTNKIT